LALDPSIVEQHQRAVDSRSRCGVSEAVGDEQPPVPVVMGIGTRVARDEVDGCFDVTGLVSDAQIKLEVGPFVRERVHDPLEVLGEQAHGCKPSVAILEQVAATDTATDRLPLEYRSLIEGCGLLDRSERGKLALSGPEAKGFLAGQVTNDIEA